MPRFFAASSPIVVQGLCIALLGGPDAGAVVACDLATGEEKWKWTGDGPGYGSPVLATIDGTDVIITPTDKNMVALNVADGKLLWQVAYSQGRYNAATPIVDGQTVIYAGPTRGITAEKIVKKGDEIALEPLWSNPDNSVQFNTPVLKDGLICGLSNLDSLFCIHAQDGKTAWTAPLTPSAGQAAQQPPGGGREAPGGARGGRRGGGGGGFGSVLDAGSVMMALTPAAELIVFAPEGDQFKQLAKYKVADSPTHAYPVVAGSRIFIKDQDAVTLWTVQ